MHSVGTGAMVLIGILLVIGLYWLGYSRGEKAATSPLNQASSAIPSASPVRPINQGTGLAQSPTDAAQSQAETTPLGPMIPMYGIIPDSASPELKEFFKNRETLSKTFAAMQAQAAKANPPVATADLAQQFRKQNQAMLVRQAQLGAIIAQQETTNPLPDPPTLQLPPDASPQLRAFLNARHQILCDQVATMNKVRTGAPETWRPAMRNWQKQNAANFEQLQHLAQDLAMTHP